MKTAEESAAELLKLVLDNKRVALERMLDSKIAQHIPFFDFNAEDVTVACILAAECEKAGYSAIACGNDLTHIRVSFERQFNTLLEKQANDMCIANEGV